MIKTIFSAWIILALFTAVEGIAQTMDDEGNIHWPNGTIYDSGANTGRGPIVWRRCGPGDPPKCTHRGFPCDTHPEKCKEILEEADDDANGRRRTNRSATSYPEDTIYESLPANLEREVQEYQLKLKEKPGKWRKHKGQWTFVAD